MFGSFLVGEPSPKHFKTKIKKWPSTLTPQRRGYQKKMSHQSCSTALRPQEVKDGRQEVKEFLHAERSRLCSFPYIFNVVVEITEVGEKKKKRQTKSHFLSGLTKQYPSCSFRAFFSPGTRAKAVHFLQPLDGLLGTSK